MPNKPLMERINSSDFIQIGKDQTAIFISFLRGEFQYNFYLTTYVIDNKELIISEKLYYKKSGCV